MTIIKRDRNSSAKDLIEAITKFCLLLEGQSENDAVSALSDAAEIIKKSAPGSEELRGAVSKIMDAFDGELELSSYILAKPSATDWTEVEELSQAATRVLSLTKRLRS